MGGSLKIIVWEPNSEQLVDSLSGKFSTSLVGDKEKLFNEIQGSSEIILIMDIDIHKDEIFGLSDEIDEVGAEKDIKKIFSSESYGPTEFKQLQKKGLLADALLNRPHDINDLIELINDLSEEFEGGNEGDIKLEVTSSFNDAASNDSLGDNSESLNLDFDSTTASALESDLSVEANENVGLPDSLIEGGENDGVLEFNELQTEDSDSASVEFDLPSEDSDSSSLELSSTISLDDESEDDFSLDSDDSEDGDVEVHTSAVIDTKQILEQAGLEPVDGHDEEQINNEEATLQTEQIEGDDDATGVTQLYSKEEQFEEFKQPNEEGSLGSHKFAPDEIEPDSESSQNESPIHFQMNEEIKETIQKARESEEATTIVGAEELKESRSARKESSQKDQVRDESTPGVYEQIYKEEIMKLKATIENLKSDREDLIEKNHQANQLINEFKFRLTGIQADFDEAKIELDFIRKKFEKEREDYILSRDQALERRDLLLAKNEELKKELDLQTQKVKFDVQKAKEREKVLEGQLELLKADSESLIKSRDKKILDLKRSIDSLEFDLETLSESERKSRSEKVNLEEKLNRIMSTLRRTIGSLDEEILSEKIVDRDKNLTEL